MRRIRKAIIPAAGLGTRFLPATKAMPKEMLPIVDKPTIQYIVEEAIESGIEDIIIVTGKGKRAIEDHFDSSFELEQNLLEKKKFELLNEVQKSSKVDIHYIRQKEPRGLGHAIWCARKFIGNEPFAVLLGDDIIRADKPCLQQMMEQFDIPSQRSPCKLNNIRAYHQLKSIIDENKYEIIHCHTPMGGVLARLAARAARKQGTKVIYTAHGFHFCKGAPIINWLVYYPLEKILSRLTDCLITINEEDYALAVKQRLKAKRIERVHGVGVDTERFKPMGESHKSESRINIGYKSDDFLMFYAAEFNKNKNQQ